MRKYVIPAPKWTNTSNADRKNCHHYIVFLRKLSFITEDKIKDEFKKEKNIFIHKS